MLIVSLGGISGWWLGRSMAQRATREVLVAAKQSQAISALSIALLESLPFGADYLPTSNTLATQRNLLEDIQGLRRFRMQLDSRLSGLLLEGIRPDVHRELEEIRLLTVQSEAQLRSIQNQLPSLAAGPLPPAVLISIIQQPSLRALKRHSVVLNVLLRRLDTQRHFYERQQAEALAAGSGVMVLSLLLAWMGGLLYAWYTGERIMGPISLLEQSMRGWVGSGEMPSVDWEPFQRAPMEIASLASSFDELGRRQSALVERLQEMALTDGLTAVGNRRCFDQALEREWDRMRRQNRPLSLLIIDVDHFKAFNDASGHAEGDQCLIQVASAIRSQARRSSDLTCRIGGEEFALLLPDTAQDHARSIAEQVWQAVRHLAIPHLGLGEGGRVSISIGVATAYPAVEESPQALQLHADLALYQRKNNQGRNGVSVATDPGTLVGRTPGDGQKSAVGTAEGVA